ncbi:signal peptidase complex subunit [Anaeramoeba flamelloides]|uniref:Signal peptidase complex subunit 2 n=1 Tax=Anaeramoeba flamelloides TaxID=1746091 RepID=A0AAV7YCK6_9EUKA|nr:signal peptidase complex subunit [Anaeramoeba flamelloides]
MPPKKKKKTKEQKVSLYNSSQIQECLDNATISAIKKAKFRANRKSTWIFNAIAVIAVLCAIAGYKFGQGWSETGKKFAVFFTACYFVIWCVINILENFFEGNVLFFSKPKTLFLQTSNKRNKKGNQKEEKFSLAINVAALLPKNSDLYKLTVFEQTDKNRWWYQYKLRRFKKKEDNSFVLAEFNKSVGNWFDENGVFLKEKFVDEVIQLLENAQTKFIDKQQKKED